MAKPSDNRVKVETWTVRKPAGQPVQGSTHHVVNKIAVRNSLGQFHGATNFRGSVVK
jgi:hypothetical protein